MKISAAIITYNEEANIRDAIESVKWADEIIVVDSESTDNTRAIAEELGARVIVKPWLGFSRQKQLAVDSATNDWIFSLDADERVSETLRGEIDVLKQDTSEYHAFTIPRLSIYMGREIRHSGWYPDRQMRLFDRTKGCWSGRVVHESFELVDGTRAGELQGNILHFSVSGPLEHAKMIATRYAPLGAQQMRLEGKVTGKTRAILSAGGTFLRSYLVKRGFLDGFPGFCIATLAAQNTLLKHLMLAELFAGEKSQPEMDAPDNR